MFPSRTAGLVLALVAGADAFGALGRGVVPGSSRVAPIRMMPIGVPKVGLRGTSFHFIGAHVPRCSLPQVAYRAPGSQQADWVDLYNRLYRERILFLGQQIDDEITNQVRAPRTCSLPGAACSLPGTAVVLDVPPFGTAFASSIGVGAGRGYRVGLTFGADTEYRLTLATSRTTQLPTAKQRVDRW